MNYASIVETVGAVEEKEVISEDDLYKLLSSIYKNPEGADAIYNRIYYHTLVSFGGREPIVATVVLDWYLKDCRGLSPIWADILDPLKVSEHLEVFNGEIDHAKLARRVIKGGKTSAMYLALRYLKDLPVEVVDELIAGGGTEGLLNNLKAFKEIDIDSLIEKILKHPLNDDMERHLVKEARKETPITLPLEGEQLKKYLGGWLERLGHPSALLLNNRYIQKYLDSLSVNIKGSIETERERLDAYLYNLVDELDSPPVSLGSHQ